jgi:RecG-like helicase
VSSWDFTAPGSWGGRPIAGELGAARPRQRILVTGTIRALRTITRNANGSPALYCLFEDETGEVELVFLGRSAVPGLSVGTRLTVEGTLGREGGRLVCLNPRYRIEAGEQP